MSGTPLGTFTRALGHYVGGGDNLHFLDFGHTQPTVGAKHKINDFCFLDFFISMKNTPYQGQKTIFHQFEQCGISLDMFERVK